MIKKTGVPTRKIIIGVASYSRSFKGCYGPDYFYTMNRLNLEAKKGIYTDTAGYVANGKIDEISEDKSYIIKHYVDSSSYSNILIYGDN